MYSFWSQMSLQQGRRTISCYKNNTKQYILKMSSKPLHVLREIDVLEVYFSSTMNNSSYKLHSLMVATNTGISVIPSSYLTEELYQMHLTATPSLNVSVCWANFQNKECLTLTFASCPLCRHTSRLISLAVSSSHLSDRAMKSPNDDSRSQPKILILLINIKINKIYIRLIIKY